MTIEQILHAHEKKRKNVFAIATMHLKHLKILLGLNVITSFDI